MADKFRFFNIGKANAEIDRLESLVADRDTALSAAQEKITSLEAQPKPENDQATKDLATAKQTIGTLESQVKSKDGEIASLKASITTKDKEISDTKASVDKQASEKAATITAKQGQSPVVIKTVDQPASKTSGQKNWTELCLAEKGSQNKPA